MRSLVTVTSSHSSHPFFHSKSHSKPRNASASEAFPSSTGSASAHRTAVHRTTVQGEATRTRRERYLREQVEAKQQPWEIPWEPWGLQELEALRQVHALEHATVWILSNHPEIAGSFQSQHLLQDDGRLSGLSTPYGFYLYGPANTARIKWSASVALRRLCAGEHELALHPRCGTNLAANFFLTAGLTMGLSSLLPKRPLEQLAGLGISMALAQSCSKELGSWCQANLTTATPSNLQLDQVTQTHDFWGRPAHFVRVHWVDSVPAH